MPTGAGSPSRTPQHGDSVERQSPLWTPASSVLVPCLLVSNTQSGVWWWMMHRSREGCFVSGTGVGQDGPAGARWDPVDPENAST